MSGAAGPGRAATVTTLLGPVLTQQGIDHGVLARDDAALTRVVLLYLGVVAANVALSWSRQRWNGRLGEDVMYGLRVRLFSHFQRLSLDWYTAEKSGVR